MERSASRARASPSDPPRAPSKARPTPEARSPSRASARSGARGPSKARSPSRTNDRSRSRDRRAGSTDHHAKSRDRSVSRDRRGDSRSRSRARDRYRDRRDDSRSRSRARDRSRDRHDRRAHSQYSQESNPPGPPRDRRAGRNNRGAASAAPTALGYYGPDRAPPAAWGHRRVDEPAPTPAYYQDAARPLPTALPTAGDPRFPAAPAIALRDATHPPARGVPSTGKPFSSEANQMSKVVERARKRIAVKAPVYAGPSPGELSIENCAVLLQHKITSILRTLDGGVLRLEPDVMYRGFWATMPDVHTPRRRELLADLLHEHLLTHNQITSAETVPVYRITGEVVETPRDNVTATDWLRISVREYALTAGALEYATAAFQALVMSTPEAMPTAAARVLAAFRATLVDPDRPHLTEKEFFWRYISTAQMHTLFERIAEVLIPNPFDRAGVNGLLHERIHEVSTKLQLLRHESHNPMGDHMRKRGQTAEHLYLRFVDVMSARSKAYMNPPAPRKSTRAGGPDRLCAANSTARHLSMAELRQLLTTDGLASLQQILSTPTATGSSALRQPLLTAGLTSVAAVAPPVAAPEPPAPITVAAFQNRAASVPGQYGVPFTAKPPAQPAPSAATGAAPMTPPAAPDNHRRSAVTPTTLTAAAGPVEHPPATAPRTVITNHLRDQRICFAHAFSACRHPNQCRWRHDSLPAGFYKDTPRSSSRPARVLAAMTPAQYDTAIALGLDLHVSGEHEVAMQSGDIPMGPGL